MPIEDTDIFLLNNANQSYKISAADLKTALSSSGSSWTSTPIGTGRGEFYSVAFGNNRWIASSYSTADYMMWSDDGITWEQANNFNVSACYGVGADNNKFIAVGSGFVQSSDDGKTWTNAGSIGNAYFDVTYGNGVWIAVGNAGGHIRSENNGTSFTEVFGQGLPNSQWRGIAYGNGRFVCVGNGGNTRIAWSENDGNNWNTVFENTSAWMDVAFGNGRFVAIASDGSGDTIMWSINGETWTKLAPPEYVGWNSITFGNGEFVAVGGDGSKSGVMRSPDGENWTMETPANNNKWYSVAFGNDRFVAVAQTGSDDRCMYSNAATPVEGIMLVNRAGVSYKCDITNLKDKLLDDDILLVNRNNLSYKVAGIDFKELLGKTWKGVATDIQTIKASYNFTQNNLQAGQFDPATVGNAFDGSLDTSFDCYHRSGYSGYWQIDITNPEDSRGFPSAKNTAGRCVAVYFANNFSTAKQVALRLNSADPQVSSIYKQPKPGEWVEWLWFGSEISSSNTAFINRFGLYTNLGGLNSNVAAVDFDAPVGGPYNPTILVKDGENTSVLTFEPGTDFSELILGDPSKPLYDTDSGGSGIPLSVFKADNKVVTEEISTWPTGPQSTVINQDLD